MNVVRTLAPLLVLVFAACATTSPQSPVPAVPAPVPAPYVEPPPPPINLQGFPPTYRLGFGDGCATSRGTAKKDIARFAGDGNYRTGWQDGVAQCKSK